MLAMYSADATHMHRLHHAKDGWEYSSGEWVQIAGEPRGIWQNAPCLPANWVLMNQWFGVLHVPRDGWCHWCIARRLVLWKRGRQWWPSGLNTGGRADTAGCALNTSLTYQMLKAVATGLLATQLHTMEIIVWRAGNSLPHLIPVTLAGYGQGGHRLAVGSTRRDVTVRKQMSMALDCHFWRIWQNPKLGGTAIFDFC